MGQPVFRLHRRTVRHMTRSVHDGTRCFADVSYVSMVPFSSLYVGANASSPSDQELTLFVHFSACM